MNTLIFLCLITLSLYPYHTASLASSNVTASQTRALQSFKDMVSDPLGSLLSWNSSNDHPCRWRGVGCGRKHGGRIVELNLNSFGLIGGISPSIEYGAGNMVSTHGDIYSYGILVLEMITGKRPTDNMFDQGLSLRNYVEMAFENRALDIVDVELVKELENGPATVDDPTNQRKITSMISLLKLGIFCTEDMPSSRISTKDIIKDLHAVKC